MLATTQITIINNRLQEHSTLVPRYICRASHDSILYMAPLQKYCRPCMFVILQRGWGPFHWQPLTIPCTRLVRFCCHVLSVSVLVLAYAARDREHIRSREINVRSMVAGDFSPTLHQRYNAPLQPHVVTALIGRR